MMFFLLLFAFVGNVSAQESCSALFFQKPFERTVDDQYVERALTMYDWYRSASRSLRPTIERQIHRIFREWEWETGAKLKQGFPVRPLHVIPVYYGEMVTYLTPQERAQLKVEMSDSGLLFSSTRQLVGEQISGDFVVSLEGEIYIHYNLKERNEGVYKHTSILSLAPVLFAGEIQVNAQGQVSVLTNRSGHYQPRKKHLLWVREFLTERGFDVLVSFGDTK